MHFQMSVGDDGVRSPTALLIRLEAGTASFSQPHALFASWTTGTPCFSTWTSF